MVGPRTQPEAGARRGCRIGLSQTGRAIASCGPSNACFAIPILYPIFTSKVDRVEYHNFAILSSAKWWLRVSFLPLPPQSGGEGKILRDRAVMKLRGRRASCR